MATFSDEKTATIQLVRDVPPDLSVAEVLLQHPSLPLYRNIGLIKLYLVVVPGVLMVSATVGYEGSMLNGLQSLNTFNNYFNPSSAISGLINSSSFLGAILSFPFAPYVATRWGRKSLIYSGSGLILIAMALQGAAKNLGMFVVARILFGFAGTLAGNGAPVLMAELAHPRDRKVTTALYNGFYYIGAIAAAWITYGTFPINNTYGWRIPSYLQGAFGILNLAFIWLVPESPRWLVANGRIDEARRILAKAHTNGDAEDRLVVAQVNEIVKAIGQEQALNQSQWAELFTARRNRKRLFILLFIGSAMNLSGNGLVSYYLSRMLNNIGITSEYSQTLINGILTIISFLTCLVASWACNWVRRRTQFLTSTIVMFISFLSVTIANSVVANDADNKHAAIAEIFFIFLFMCGYNWAFNPLAYAYPVEILPYNIRIVGLSTVNLSCMIAGFFNTWVNPVALEAITWKYYIVYVIWLTFETLVVFFIFPETLGYALEEVSAILDNDSFFTSRKTPTKVEQILANDEV